MPGGIIQIGISPTPQQTQAVSERPAAKEAVVVQSRGQEIATQPSQGSLIQQAITDSAEEVTMMFQDKSADRLKRRDAKSKSASRVDEILRKYLKGVNGVTNAHKFDKLTENLKQLDKPTPQQIRDLIEQYGEGTDEDGVQTGVLLALEELFSTEPTDNGVLDAIRQVKSELGHELRDFYHDTVKSYGDVNDVYEQLLGDYGEEDFLTATDAMIARLGKDLHAEGTSVDANKVKSTVDSLYHLEVARNTFTSFAKLVNNVNTVFTPGQA